MKKLLNLVFIGLLTVGLFAGCSLKKKEKVDPEVEANKVTTNTNTEVIKDKVVDGLKMSNISLKSSQVGSTFNAVVTNTTQETISLRLVDVILKDEDGKVITELQSYVGDSIAPGESKELVNEIDIDLNKSFSVDYKIIK